MKANLSRWKKAQTTEIVHYESIKTRWESIDSWKRFLRETFFVDFEFFRDKKVLEVGCGAFGIIHYVDVPCFNVGIDPLCSRYIGLNDEHTTHTHQITGIGEHLPFKNEVFDGILSFNILDHCLDPYNVLKEIKRTLKKDGVVLLYLYTFDLPKWLRLRSTLFDRPHPYHFSHDEIISIFKKSGFSIDNQYRKNKKIKFKIFSGDFVHNVKYLVAGLLRIQLSVYVCSKRKL